RRWHYRSAGRRRSVSCWHAPTVLEDASKRLEVARVAALLAAHPVFGTPEEVGVERTLTTRIRCEPLVVGVDQVFGQTAVHPEALRIRRCGHGLPRLGLAFGNHQLAAVLRGLSRQLAAPPHMPGHPTPVHVERS